MYVVDILDLSALFLVGFILGYLVSIPITRRNIRKQLEKNIANILGKRVKKVEVEIDLNLPISEIEEQLSSHYNLPKEVVKQILDEVKRIKEAKNKSGNFSFRIIFLTR